MQTTQVSVPGGELSMRVWAGPDDAVPLLLLHAGGENSTLWTSLAERWCEFRTVYAPDFRGHGDSDRSEMIAWRYSMPSAVPGSTSLVIRWVAWSDI